MGTEREGQLQRYFDGELTEEERRSFETGLTEGERAELQGMAELGCVVGNVLTAAAAEVDLAIEIEAARRLSAERGPRSSEGEVATARPLRARLRRARLTAAVMIAAAGLLLLARSWSTSHDTPQARAYLGCGWGRP